MIVFYRSATGKPLSVADETWINCGYETVRPIVPTGNVAPSTLLDWEPVEAVRRTNYEGWRAIAYPKSYVYDPLGIRPWDYIGVWNTLTGHSRRAMRGLTDHAKRLAEVGIDGINAVPCVSIYTPLGYDYHTYMEWAGAKLKAARTALRAANIRRCRVLIATRQSVSQDWADSVPHKREQLEWQVEAYRKWGFEWSGLALWGYSYNEQMLTEDRAGLDMLKEIWPDTPAAAKEGT